MIQWEGCFKLQNRKLKFELLTKKNCLRFSQIDIRPFNSGVDGKKLNKKTDELIIDRINELIDQKITGLMN